MMSAEEARAILLQLVSSAKYVTDAHYSSFGMEVLFRDGSRITIPVSFGSSR